tara:strand:- start:60 stop:413 length:354 start_codon:yes stop_codon:yes gene_type:complete
VKPWRLTHQAEQSLVEIAEWTVRRFGAEQALAYRDALIARLDALASGQPPHPRPCDLLMQGRAAAAGLVFYREGGHYIVMRETEALLEVLDVLHERSDLSTHILRLSRDREAKDPEG